MTGNLKNRILNALNDYVDTLDHLDTIIGTFGNTDIIATTADQIDALITDVSNEEVTNLPAPSPNKSTERRAVITNSGVSYTTYESFFTENAIDEKYAKRYDYDVTPSEDDTYIVVGAGYHTYYGATKIYVLQNIDTYRVYLVAEEGVKFID